MSYLGRFATLLPLGRAKLTCICFRVHDGKKQLTVTVTVPFIVIIDPWLLLQKRKMVCSELRMKFLSDQNDIKFDLSMFVCFSFTYVVSMVRYTSAWRTSQPSKPPFILTSLTLEGNVMSVLSFVPTEGSCCFLSWAYL